MARNVSTSRRVPFSYQSGATVLHRFPAGLKLLALFVLSIAAFGSLPGLLLSALLVIAASCAARIRPWELLRGSRPLLVLALFILIFQTIDPGARGSAPGGIAVFGLNVPDLAIPGINAAGFVEGVLSGLRIMVSFAAGSLLFAVTTMRELRLSLGKAERAIAGLFVRKAPADPRAAAKAASRQYSRLSLAISLMLGFIPRFFELWETINLACEARSGRRGFRRLTLVIPLVTERMMEIAADTAEALQARGI